MSRAQIHELAVIDFPVEIGDGSRIWHFAHIRPHVHIGKDVTIGKGVYIGSGVSVGDNSKIQNNSLIYEPTEIESGVFIGPGVICTNDRYPRAVNPDESQKNSSDWELVGVLIRHGASIGAGAICVAPLEIGSWAIVAAGSVVTKDVPPFALVSGNPAKFMKWVGRSGHPLQKINDENFKCPKTGEVYELQDEMKLVLT